MNKKILTNCFLIFALFAIGVFYSQTITFVNPVNIDSRTLRGDMTIIGNNIINRNIASGTNAGTPNQPFAGTLQNNGQNLQFIDIDGDASTFNSSSATLTLPSTCNRVRFAALYWSGIYNDNNRINGQPINRANFNSVRFRLPTGGYVNITGNIIHDTFGVPNTNNIQRYYSAWADVTGLMNNATNGVYTVADITTGTSVLTATGGLAGGTINPGGGYSSGWSLYVVYEDPTQVFRRINAFNGASIISGGSANTLTIPVTGFQTIPVGPVRAKLAFNALEGDYNLVGDRISINGGQQAMTVPNPTRGGIDTRPVSNFFNATVNDLGGVNTTRTPNSDNTFGWDTGIIQVNNPNNQFIANNANNANITITTSGDQYYYTFTAFSIDVINPDIELTKTAYDATGTSITTNPATVVNLGQVLRYDLCFRNIGNDDAINYTIRDDLPANVDFLSVSVPSGVMYTYSAATHSLLFSIDPLLVRQNETASDCISIYVRVISDCNQLRDACSNYITNRAFQTYSSLTSGQVVVNNQESFTEIDSCGYNIPSSVNILGDRSGCNFQDTFVKCSNDPVTISAPLNYTSYEWTLPDGTVVTTSDNFITIDSSILTGGGPWTIPVHAIAPAPCTDIDVVITIEEFDLVAQNPLPPLDDATTICPSNGDILSKFYLCGQNDTETISLNVASALSITWFSITNCPVGSSLGPDCPNTSNACTFTQVGTGTSFTATDAGSYKVTIAYQNGCRADYYFDVYKNLFNATETHRDIICNTPGRIIVSGVPSNYLFAFVPCTDPAPAVGSPLYTSNNQFTTNTQGCYTVYIIQNDPGVVNPCVFSIPNIPIRLRNVQVSVTPTDALCHDARGSIRIQISDAEPQYNYEIRTNPGNTLVASSGTVNVTDFTFNNLNPGSYNVITSSTDGCSFTNSVTIGAPPQLIASANITRPLTCLPATIQVNIVGGTPNYSTFFDGALSGLTIQTTVPGNHTIRVTDFNGCFVDLIINVPPYVPPVYTVSSTPALCNNQSTGSATVNVTNANGFVLGYAISTVVPPTDPDDLIIYHNSIAYTSVNSFTNLAPGTYYVNINWSFPNSTDYCYEDRMVVITNPTPLTGTIALTPRSTCVNTQQICVTGVSGGTGAGTYQYALNGALPSQGSNCFAAVGPGTYFVRVIDANGCTFDTGSVTINPLVPITDINFTYNAITCTNPTTLVTPTALGGNGAVTFVANPGNITLPANLAPNTYTVTATDSLGCTYSESLTVLPVVNITVTSVVSNNVICFGTATGTAILNVPNSTNYNYSVSPGGLSGSNIATPNVTLSNLAAGNYTITVTDNVTGCTATSSFSITQPTAALALNPPTLNPVTCAVLSGSATINAIGGWGSNQYTLTLPNGTVVGPQPSNIFIGLTQFGVYNYTVRDLNGCTVTGSFTFTMPVPPILTISTTSDYCFDNVNQAAITVVGSSGTNTGYTYAYNTVNSITAGAFTNATGVFTNLGPGTYYFFVRDNGNGCISAGQAVTINPQLLASASLTKGLDCTVSPNATIAVNITGGYTPFTYRVSFNGAAYAGAGIPVVGSSFVYSTANAGTYRFEITDSRGCVTQTNTITVNALVPLTLNAVSGPAINCFADATGSIIVTPGGGQPNYTINVQRTLPTAINFGAQTTGLPAGTYTVTVTDALSCPLSQTVTITQPDDILYTPIVNPLQCTMTGTSLGSIQVNGLSGGVAPFTYVLSGGPTGFTTLTFNAATGQNHTFPNLDFGNYTLTITDGNGCTKVSSPLIITSPPSDLVIDLTTPVVSCVGGATVNVNVTISGTPLLQYGIYTGNIATTLFLPVGGTPSTMWTFTGLPTSTNVVIIVRDLTTGCFYFESILTPPLPGLTLAVTPTPRNVSCPGAADGCIGASISGVNAATTNLSYQIVDFFNQPLIPPINGTITVAALTAAGNNLPCLGSLAPGQYYIRVLEVDGPNAGCGSSSILVNIQQSATPPTVTAIVVKNDNCNLNAGQIFATGSGGTPSYSFLVVAAGTPAPTIATWGTGIYANTNTTGVFNVEGGSYDIYIRDAYNCIRAQLNLVVPTDPILDFVAIQDASTNCNNAEGSYEIDLTINAGIGPFTYYVNGAAGGVQITPNPTVFPYNFSISGLNSGPYSIRIVDKNGCDLTRNLTIRPPLDLSVTIAIQTNPLCDVDVATITAVATGGSGAPNYEYSILPNTSSSGSPNLTGVFLDVDASATPYVISVRDLITGCTDTVSITVPLAVPVTVTPGDLDINNVSCTGGSDGTVTVNLPASNTQGPYTYQLFQGAVPLGANQIGVFTGLSAANNYSIVITSARNCSVPVPFTITEPALLTALATLTTPFLCNASNVPQPAAVTVTGSGGTAPYFYSATGLPGSYGTNNVFTITNSGLLTFYVSDANGCVQTDDINVDPLPVMNQPTVTLTTALNCSQSGVLTVSVTGGSGNYSYLLLNNMTPLTLVGASGVLTVTTPGAYNFLVTDLTTGCTRNVSYDVPAFINSTAVATTVTNVNCFGDTTGVISVNVSNYTGAYTYTVFNNGVAVPAQTNVAGNTTTNPLIISNLPFGNYTVEFTKDPTAYPTCTFISTATAVVAPGSPVNGTFSTTPVTCNTPPQGSITVNASGGTGMGYTVAFYQGAGPTGGTLLTNTAPFSIQNLAAGNYYFIVTDSNGCTFTSSTINLAAPTPITAGTLSAVPTVLPCKGDVLATLTVVGTSGGFGSGYTYTLSQTNPAYPLSTDINSNGVFAPKGAGTYIVTIIDQWGCTATTNSVTITEPATDVTASIVLTTPLTCAANAQITLTAQGGTPPYFYNTTGVNPIINPLPVGGTTFSVPAGTYEYYVTDASNCVVARTNQIIINIIPDVIVNLELVENVACFGGNTGSVQVNATGGIINTANPAQTYTYTITPDINGVGPNFTGEFTDLIAGIYSITASTIGGCNDNVSFEIFQPLTPLTAPTPPVSYTSCFNTADACVTVNPTGGTPYIDANGVAFYQYRITPPTDTLYINNNTFCNLAPGNYTVEAVDSNGCFILIPITVAAPTQIVANGILNTNLTEICFGDTVTFTGSVTGGREANTPPLPYVIEIRDLNGVLVTSTLSATGDFTFTGLDSLGSPYSVTIFVQGTPTCNWTFPLIVNPGVDIQLTPDIDITCTGTVPVQTVTIVATVNSPYLTSDLTYSLDGGPYTADNVFSTADTPPLAPGLHTVNVRHTNGCNATPVTFTIQNFAPLALLVTPNVALNQFSAIASGGSPDYTYTVNGVPHDFAQNYLISFTGNYTVVVTDANGCSVTETIYMEFIPIKIPNFFTPNGSGNNDTWAPFFIENYPNAIFEIYDRYGRRLRILTYQEAWDGSYEGNPMPSGDYWYILKLNRTDDAREFVGNFTLYR